MRKIVRNVYTGRTAVITHLSASGMPQGYVTGWTLGRVYPLAASHWK